MIRQYYSRLAGLAAVALVLSCGPDNAEAERYATEHASQLVSATRPFWEKVHDGSRMEVPEADYPVPVRALRPKQVAAVPEGVVIVVYTSYAWQTGVFVRHDPKFVPPPTRPPDSDEIAYKRLAQDVYWFSRPR